MYYVSNNFAELGEKIEQVDNDLYLVPSQRTGELTYEVNSYVGWCSCPVGKCGAFCKHQALVFTKFGKGFPNKPAINYIEKYKLARLALSAEKCPPVSFFRGFKEPVLPDEVLLNTIIVAFAPLATLPKH